MRALIALLIALSLASPAFAIDPQEQLKDPKLEARARAISSELRCLVCQNESIDDSDATLARDLRALVRQRLEKGDTDEQVVDYLVARYGEFVLLKPRFSTKTLLLWLAPLLIVCGGVALALRVLGSPQKIEARPLSAEEKAELDRLLGDTANAGEGVPPR